ncbi:transcriptional regulator [Microbacterium mangrovi]|uniref:Transcriptional regulator n=1 Tax=Microbacterium mangrovi TaxID=1348253 RepID=A0A0B1ZZ50_9MICO|nr:TetR/AcrR family transcriptional regulator [Microbacterium mangrovi]KHK96021.1 transcriptional regulator [Microbacterium mangrovi]
MTTPAAARKPRRDALENRACILTAAIETLASDPHAPLDAIARAAGVSRRTLYGHFADRDSLISELIAAGAQRFNDIALRVDDADARVALARLTALLWHEAAAVQVAAAIALDEAHVAETAAALAPLRAQVLAIVEAGRAAGALRTDMPASVLARLVEEAARAVVTRLDAATPDAAGIAVRAVLGVAGLSWREAIALIDGHPELELDSGPRSDMEGTD